MSDTYFRLSDEDDEGGRYTATPHTVGPWDAGAAHGGPPCALLTRCAERRAAAATARDDLVAARCSAEFLGPVPVGELTVSTQVLRAARSAVLVATRMHAAGRLCLQARVWLIAVRDTAAVAAPLRDQTPALDGLPGLPPWFGYADSIEWREVHGSFTVPGPGAVWARPRVPLLPGEALSGLQRAVLLGDSASGVSSELDWDTWSFANVDLDVHLLRALRGEWLHLDAATRLGPQGFALARSTLSDVAGEVGATAQTLVLAPRAGTRPAD